MSIVRVGPRGQITIPNDLRRQTKISTGSFLEAEVHHNVIVLKPVQVVDTVSAAEVEAAIAEGLKDQRAGRVSGPYKDMAEFKASRRQQKPR
jgi:bifunctional DNA-binding transcriptional regulator/antitoxin component of YhaV-PrlF toxin-antitoxin module